MDATRLDQFGFWSGWIRYDGKRTERRRARDLRPERPLVGNTPGGRGVYRRRAAGGIPGLSFRLDADPLGTRVQPGRLVRGWRRPPVAHDQAFLPHYPAMSMRYQAPPIPNTRVWQRQGRAPHHDDSRNSPRECAIITMHDRSGESMEVHLQPVLVHRMKGLGYQHPHWGHGKWQGEFAIAGESWKDSELDPFGSGEPACTASRHRHLR
jgi:hypothetical protein